MRKCVLVFLIVFLVYWNVNFLLWIFRVVIFRLFVILFLDGVIMMFVVKFRGFLFEIWMKKFFLFWYVLVFFSKLMNSRFCVVRWIWLIFIFWLKFVVGVLILFSLGSEKSWGSFVNEVGLGVGVLFLFWLGVCIEFDLVEFIGLFCVSIVFGFVLLMEFLLVGFLLVGFLLMFLEGILEGGEFCMIVGLLLIGIFVLLSGFFFFFWLEIIFFLVSFLFFVNFFLVGLGLSSEFFRLELFLDFFWVFNLLLFLVVVFDVEFSVMLLILLMVMLLRMMMRSVVFFMINKSDVVIMFLIISFKLWDLVWVCFVLVSLLWLFFLFVCSGFNLKELEFFVDFVIFMLWIVVMVWVVLLILLSVEWFCFFLVGVDFWLVCF